MENRILQAAAAAQQQAGYRAAFRAESALRLLVADYGIYVAAMTTDDGYARFDADRGARSAVALADVLIGVLEQRP